MTYTITELARPRATVHFVNERPRMEYVSRLLQLPTCIPHK